MIYPIRIWDVKMRTCMQTLKTYIVSKMAFTPDGRKLAFCMQKPVGEGYEIVFWDIASARTGPILQGPSKEIAWMWFSKDGKQLIAATRRHGVQVWDWAAGRLLYTLPIHERGAQTGVVDYLAFSPERNWLVEGLEFSPEDRIIAIWSVDKREKILEWNRPFSGLALSPDGRWLAIKKGLEFGVWEVVPKAK